MFELFFEPEKEHTRYFRGWGHEMFNAFPVIYFWTNITQDLMNKRVELTFDLTDDDDLLTI